MRKKKYNATISVCWRDVLRCLDWALMVRRHEAERWFDCVEVDFNHSYPNRLKFDIQSALDSCERVFYNFELSNSIRRYLMYKQKTAAMCGIQRCYDFYLQYKKETSCSEDLTVTTTGSPANND